jgi:hypothetical protein
MMLDERVRNCGTAGAWIRTVGEDGAFVIITA